MSNQQLIRSAHIWFLTAIIAFGLWVIAGKAGIRNHGQNPQNQNQNQNANSNTSNANQNENANRSANRNDNSRARGEHAGMSSQDHKFVMTAAMSGLREVELGRMATQQGTSDAVKQFGQRVVDDHSKANSELATLASSKGMTLPTAVDEKNRAEITKLSAMSGADFDRAFSRMMLKSHEKGVDLFEKQSTKGTDADLKAFAAKILPTLQEHLQMARALPGNQRGNRNDNGNTNSGSRNANGNSNSNSNRP